MRYWLLIVLFAWMGIAHAAADDATPAAAMNGPQVDPSVTPEMRVALEHLFVVIKLDELMATVVKNQEDTYAKQMPNILVAIANARVGDDQAAYLQFLQQHQSDFNDYLAKIFSDMLANQFIEVVCINVYSKYLTVDDVKALTAFYATPAGRKVMASLPGIMQDVDAQIKIMAPALIKSRFVEFKSKLDKEYEATKQKAGQ